ncbi:hypothetical protein AGR6A_pTi0254 [Agrobacterium sp. NCPPB 925]|uniref:Uncharacterized protein n=1 Tax=Agrobacterium genomosp. 6 TaxID=1183411 RepID=A0A2Z2PES0_9HYPH|nr:hypothetical protein [Agrobacterium genomosp. 6]ASK41523.1 hypothetical protein [Agrobacterium genomosp. 6]CUX71736.1 hypothetical protein AGR6A_pTi0254 [Agrobacterium sp. NCPPB 925]
MNDIAIFLPADIDFILVRRHGATTLMCLRYVLAVEGWHQRGGRNILLVDGGSRPSSAATRSVLSPSRVSFGSLSFSRSS